MMRLYIATKDGQITSNYIIKIIAFICLIAFIVALIIAWINPSAGYELDIYSKTPLPVWILLTLVASTGITIHCTSCTKEQKTNHLWLTGIILVILSRLFILWLPFIRNYYTWDGDNIIDFGTIIDICNTGNINLNNSYPITHILLQKVIQITDLPPRITINLSPSRVLFYIIAIYLLSKIVISNNCLSIFICIIIFCNLYSRQVQRLFNAKWMVNITITPVILFIF
jgi:hypothetical protein